MAKSKLTLIVDGNWLMMSRLATVIKHAANDEDLCNDLKLLMIRSINVALRTFPMIDNVIFVADGGSWRSDVDIPDDLKNADAGAKVEYKGNRSLSDNINWTKLFEAYDSFRATLEECGITVCRENNIEGDDWCWYWSKTLNDKNTNCIIWSKDNDLKQLVSTNANKCFTVWWNKDNGLFTDNYCEDDMDFLFNQAYSENAPIFDELCAKAKCVNNIVPANIVIDKIIRGDAGDNIKPIIYKTSKNGSGRNMRVAAKDIDFDLAYNDDAAVHRWIADLIESSSYKGRCSCDADTAFRHFIYNRTLVALQSLSYPQNILETLSKYTLANVCKNTVLAESKIKAETESLTGLLDII